MSDKVTPGGKMTDIVYEETKVLPDKPHLKGYTNVENVVLDSTVNQQPFDLKTQRNLKEGEQPGSSEGLTKSRTQEIMEDPEGARQADQRASYLGPKDLRK